MRKFRVWDKEKKQWRDNDNIYIDQDGDIWEIEERNWAMMSYMYKERLNDKVEIVLDTGLKDANGKEIYDQDLWRHLVGSTPRVVKWHKNGWWLHHPKTDMPLRLLERAEDGEIIGNVFQHPHLLEGEQA